MNSPSPFKPLGCIGRPLYILPGATRGEDRIIPVELLTIHLYEPSKDANLTTDTRIYAVNVLKVTVEGEEMRMLPFVLPCDFYAGWNDIEAAARAMGRTLTLGDPVAANDESIGRSTVCGYLATADGAVYKTKSPKRDLLFAYKLPICLPRPWIDEHLSRELLNY